MSFIEKKILAEKNPLYGRATGILKMREMSFYDAIQFFPGYSNHDKILAYAVLGGIPHYSSNLPTVRICPKTLKTIFCKRAASFIVKWSF